MFHYSAAKIMKETYIHTNIHTYIHTYINTDIHTYTLYNITVLLTKILK